MKRLYILLLTVLACNTIEPIKPEPQIEFTIKKQILVFDGGNLYIAYDDTVRNVGIVDIKKMFPKITFEWFPGYIEVAYGAMGERQDQSYNGVKNPRTHLNIGEKSYFFVKTRVLPSEPINTTLSFEVQE